MQSPQHHLQLARTWNKIAQGITLLMQFEGDPEDEHHPLCVKGWAYSWGSDLLANGHQETQRATMIDTVYQEIQRVHQLKAWDQRETYIRVLQDVILPCIKQTIIEQPRQTQQQCPPISPDQEKEQHEQAAQIPHTDPIATDLWTQVDTPELSREEVLQRIQDHWSELSGLRASLRTAKETFRSQRWLWPDQCHQFVTAFRAEETHLQTFTNFLDTGQQFPHPLLSFRYPFLHNLHLLQEQLSNTCTLLTRFSFKEQTKHEQYPLSDAFTAMMNTMQTIQRQISRLEKKKLHLS